MKVVGFIRVPEADMAAVEAHLDEHIRLTRAEAGCLEFSVRQRPDDAHMFDVYEEFVDERAFKAHRERAAKSAWGKITRNVSRHYDVQPD